MGESGQIPRWLLCCTVFSRDATLVLAGHTLTYGVVSIVGHSYTRRRVVKYLYTYNFHFHHVPIISWHVNWI